MMALTPLRSLLLQPCMDNTVVAGAQHDDTSIVRERWSAFGQRVDVMDVQGAPAVTGNVGEVAVSVAVEDARAELPPGLSLVESGHGESPANRISTGIG